ncbi:MAG: hypothetical protein K8H89_14685 [Flavobacteriales bacterium]|nr:hypothetical protein [Flavobacteriales bacterium]
MDRPIFLKTMLGSAALLTLPPWTMLNAKEQDRLAWTQDRTASSSSMPL